MLTQRQSVDTIRIDQAQSKLQASSYSQSRLQKKAVIIPISSDSKCDSGDEADETVKHAPTLSVRAQQAKQQLNSGSVVDAVVLNRTGGFSQIKYNTTPSLRQANTILNGRPTIVGEFEELGVIIVRAMHSGCSCQFGRNTHRLPAPFQSEQACGDFLLYRVDADGAHQDFSVKEYQEFEQKMRSETEEALLNQEEETETRREVSIAESVRQQIDLRVREEFVAELGRVPTEQEAQRSVDATLQVLIESMVSRPARDGDYDPAEDEREQREAIQSEHQAHQEEIAENLSPIREEEQAEATDELLELWQDENESSMTLQQFREELDSAMGNVRRLARSDGQKLAVRLAETFFELNGREPEVTEITNVFRRIRASLEMEAQEEVNEDEDDDGTAEYFNQKYDGSFNEAPSQDLVEYAKRIVTEDLITRSRSKLFLANGKTPNSYEVRLEMLDIFQEIVDRGEESLAVTNDSELNQRDTDQDYDPENEYDQQLRKNDEQEDAQFEQGVDEQQRQAQSQDWTPVKMLSTPTKQKATAIQYDVYFENAENLSAKLNQANTEKARDRFLRMHRREPNDVEAENMKLFVSASVGDLTEVEYEIVPEGAREDRPQTPQLEENELKQDEEFANNGSVEPQEIQVLTTPVKQKPSSARYELFFDKTNESTNEKAMEWFKRMSKRNPTESETQNIAQFLATDKSELTSQVVNVQ